MIDEKKLRTAIAEVRAEYRRARTIHKPMNGPHEAYAVILEEVEEFWDDVKHNRANRKELIQIAAMCVAALCEVPLREGLTMHEGETIG